MTAVMGGVLMAMAWTTAWAQEKVLWNGHAAEKNEPSSRIPAIICSADGTLLAFSDVRTCRNDIGYGEVDIQMRRSTDKGMTWSPAVTVADGTGVKGADDCGYGDASVVADNGGSGRVLMMCAAGNVVFTQSTNEKRIHIARFRSEDNGVSWSEATDVTDYFYDLLPPTAKGIFFTSGKITQSRYYRRPGSLYNRLYACLVTHCGNYVIYSDDFGDSWDVLGGKVAQPKGDEAHIAETPDGNIILSGRGEWGSVKRYINLFTYTNKRMGEGSWGHYGEVNGTEGVACNGDIIVVDRKIRGKDVKVLLQSAPRLFRPRRELTYYYKVLPAHPTLADLTEGWQQGGVICAGPSAYSSMVKTADGQLLIFYERAEETVADESLTTQTDPWGYDMVVARCGR